ncbi:protein fem-1 homolog CG6966 [Chelonus insularis]|uniref:protein fem-1 homolog CG6966 n=1 Tax=Chelonus insularis TaxID=460826 RepID=UPI00158D080B|nr:protein fem-1 homolog CG6966 [Chelonus insularis]
MINIDYDIRIVYHAAADGELRRLKRYLDNRDRCVVKELVSTKTNGATPLVIACRYGHFDVAEYLIEKCDADIEQRGSVVFDGETITGAPPLWCAAAAGHFSLVRLLVESRAKVNATTTTNSTPLRAACFDGHIGIVQYLISHGADIEIANEHGHTCLMIACFRGHVEIAKLLLALNADINRKSLKGNTALHDCAESGSLEIVKLLMDHGARMDVDSCGMTPLLAAAIAGHMNIVEYLIGMPQLVLHKDKIDALQILGATYVDKKRDLLGALECWKRAMEERCRGDEPVLEKLPRLPVVKAYDYAQEVNDLAALDDLLADPDEMRMQALLIRERILGPVHPDTSYYIRHRGAMYADSGQFDRCIELWNYALDMQQSVLEPLNSMTQSSFNSFIDLFRLMLGKVPMLPVRGRRVPPINDDEIMRVFKKAVLEVKVGKQMLEKIPYNDRNPNNLDRILITALYLADLLVQFKPDAGTGKSEIVHKEIYELVRINAKDKAGRNVLQMAHYTDTTSKNLHPIHEICSADLSRALLKAGADPTSVDGHGNSALHLIAMSDPWREDLIEILLESGAHYDAVNNRGKTFVCIINDKRQYASHSLKYVSLMCLAARAVRKSNIDINRIPKHLQSFVLLH